MVFSVLAMRANRINVDEQLCDGTVRLVIDSLTFHKPFTAARLAREPPEKHPVPACCITHKLQQNSFGIPYTGFVRM